MTSLGARLIRWWKAVRTPAPLHVSPEAALAIAQQQCKERGWPFAEPVTIDREHNAYKILTFANMRGGNVRLTIDGNTGAVLYAGFVRY